MSSKRGKTSKRGVGTCGNPFCKEPKAPDRFLCVEHAEQMDEIKERSKKNPKLIYNQRSDQRNIMSPRRDGRARKAPTCCYSGCFEPRDPPNPFCVEHANVGMYD